MTMLAAVLASVTGDAPLSTSYGAPHSDSYGGHHGGHETVKRHTGTGGQDCNCSGGSSYNGGSASVQPVHANMQPTKPNYNVIMSPPQPPPPTVPPPPPPPPPQPYNPPPVVQQSPQPTKPNYNEIMAPPQPPPTVPPPPPPPPQPQNYPAYIPPPVVQQSPQPTKPDYNALQAPSSVPAQPPPPPSPVYSGGGQPMYSGGRPDYNAYPPQGYAGWGLSTKPYNFGYSVKDFHQGTDFKQQETSDGNTVKGQYRVQLPDGRLQIVTYTADWQTGFHADVQYEGEASYPAVYGVGGSFPPSSSYGTPSQSYGTPAQTSYSAPAQTSYSAPAQTSYSAPAQTSYSAPAQTTYSAPAQTSYSSSPQASYGAPSGGSSHSGWNQGASYQERVGVGGVGSQYLNIGHSTGGSSSYGAAPSSSYGSHTSSSYSPTSYGK